MLFFSTLLYVFFLFCSIQICVCMWKTTPSNEYYMCIGYTVIYTQTRLVNKNLRVINAFAYTEKYYIQKEFHTMTPRGVFKTFFFLFHFGIFFSLFIRFSSFSLFFLHSRELLLLLLCF